MIYTNCFDLQTTAHVYLLIGASLSEPHIDWHNGPRGGECINLSICHGVAFVLFNSYGEAHTLVLYARPTRAAIARPRDCTFFHNYLTFFHNSTAKWTTRRFAFPSRFSMNHDAPGALISDRRCSKNQGFGAERKRRQRELEERHHCYLAHIIPRCIYSPFSRTLLNYGTNYLLRLSLLHPSLFSREILVAIYLI